MKNLKILLLLAMVAALSLSVIGCKKSGTAGGAGDQAELRVLNYNDLTSANASTAEERVWKVFEKANPDIKLVREDLFNEPFHQKTEAYAAAGQLPDVLYAWPAGRSSTLHTQKLLKDLGPLIKKDGLAASYTAEALDPGPQAGGYNAIIPMTVTKTHAFYVNNEVLKDAGLTPATTYAELKAQVPVLRAKGYDTVIMSNQDTWVMQSCLFSMLAGRFGGADWEKKILSGQAKFTDPDFIAALNFVKTLYDDGVIPKASLTTGYGDGFALFATNKGAYYIDGDWKVGNFITDKTTGQAVISVERQPNFTITIFPDIEGAKLNKSTSGNLGTGWGMNANIPDGSDKEAAAWRLIQFLTGPEVQAYQLEAGSITAPVVTTIDTSKLALEPLQLEIGRLSTKFDTVTIVVDDVFHASVANPLNDGLQAIGMGRQTPQQVAEATQRAFDAWKAGQ